MVAPVFSSVLPASNRDNNKLIRWTVYFCLVFGGTVAALADVQPDNLPIHIDQVVYFGEDSKLALAEAPQPLFLQKCAVEDCSDTPQN